MKILILIGLFAAGMSGPVLASDVQVTLTGVKAKGGSMNVGVYDQATFLRAKPIADAVVAVKSDGDMTVTIRNVAPGDYAIAAFHDADANGTMTMAADGRIGEGTALSNAEQLRGPPTFAVAKVAVSAAGLKVALPMSYPEDRQGW